MSEKPISPLRRRMIEDMTVRNFVEKTRNDDRRNTGTGGSPGRLPGHYRELGATVQAAPLRSAGIRNLNNRRHRTMLD